MAKRIIPLVVLLIQFCLLSGQTVIDDLFNGEINEYLISKNKVQSTLYHYKVNSTESIAYGLELYFVKVPLDLVSIRIKRIDKTDYTNAIYGNAASNKTIALITGGFWGYNELYEEIPIGLVISDGKVLSAKSKWEIGGILYQQSGAIKIEHITQFIQDEIEEGIQSRPILVNNGKIAINSDDKIYSDRICVGVTNSDELIICCVYNPNGRGISLFEFAAILINKEFYNRPNARIALAMDGGPSSHMFFPTLNLNVGYDGVNYVPNMIEIINKE